MKFKPCKTYLLLVFSITILACDDEKLTPVAQSSNSHSLEKLEVNRELFAKTLATAMEDLSVRQFVKDEAAKSFDGEKEFLFQLVKDKVLSGGETLMDKMISIHGSREEFTAVVESLPLLTVLVPEVYKFSVEAWDVSSQIPAVASLKVNGGDADVRYCAHSMQMELTNC